jgi:probable F420-dependent oxidoreductase
MSTSFKVGVQIEPQDTTIEALRDAWRRADELGVDSIWTWDHFHPVHGGLGGPHFEGWMQLAAMACDTARSQIGVLVSCMSYRNPDLLADMARTADHISGGRVILGVGAGWYGDEYADYGYEFGTSGDRVTALELGVRRIEERLRKLNPAPVGKLPLLIGGGGERRTLRLVAERADIWNLVVQSPDEFVRKNQKLDQWCAVVGRDPRDIERGVLIFDKSAVSRFAQFVEAGAQHVVVPVASPFDLSPVEHVLASAASARTTQRSVFAGEDDLPGLGA